MSSSENSYSSDSNEDETTSEDEVPIGFNINAFRLSAKEAQSQVAVMAGKVSMAKDVCTIDELKYENLLKRAHSQFKHDIEAKTVLKLPLVLKRENHCKTSINLVEIAEALNREPEHVKTYVLGELLTTGSINEKGLLHMKGIFIKNQIQTILKRYVDEYVLCSTCENTSKTGIVRENKLYYVKCSGCGGKRHVGNIFEGLKSKK